MHVATFRNPFPVHSFSLLRAPYVVALLSSQKSWLKIFVMQKKFCITIAGNFFSCNGMRFFFVVLLVYRFWFCVCGKFIKFGILICITGHYCARIQHLNAGVVINGFACTHTYIYICVYLLMFWNLQFVDLLAICDTAN